MPSPNRTLVRTGAYEAAVTQVRAGQYAAANLNAEINLLPVPDHLAPMAADVQEFCQQNIRADRQQLVGKQWQGYTGPGASITTPFLGQQQRPTMSTGIGNRTNTGQFKKKSQSKSGKSTASNNTQSRPSS